MSSLYHTEPPTNGKVIIRTSYGDIDIELWPKEAPLACRNFIQLALEGYFDRTKVVRIVKGFMVQMGDPTGTGLGGESIWGKPFKDEVHGRIKFNHRGQVAMANANKPHSNQSQFFITLDSCDWLNGKHTIFGKVTGSTFFNVMKMGEVDVNSEEKPVEPIHINAVEVVWNPFEDIVPRNIQKETSAKIETAPKDRDKHEKIKATKNSNLLSFGDDEDEDDTGDVQVKFKSLHDARKKRIRTNKDESKSLHKPEIVDQVEVHEEKDFDRKMKEQILEKLRQERSIMSEKEGSRKSKNSSRKDEEEDDNLVLNPERIVQNLESEQRKKILDEKNLEFKRLREELLGNTKRAVKVVTGEEAVEKHKQDAYHELSNPLEARRQKYLKRKQEHGDRSEETLQKLMKFTDNLRSKKAEFRHENDKETGKVTESYHGQILEEDDTVKEDVDDWFVGKLKCKKHIDEQYRN